MPTLYVFFKYYFAAAARIELNQTVADGEGRGFIIGVCRQTAFTTNL